MLVGPSIKPVSGIVKQIIVFLHGYGASGDNLISIAHAWRDRCADTLFVAPNAPQSCDVCPSGYQWFGLPDFNPFNIRSGLDKAVPILLNYLENLQKAYGVTSKDIYLVGFSQGTIMALDCIFQSISLGGIVGYSGAFYPPNNKNIKYSIPILLIHGTADTVVPYAAMMQAQLSLAGFGANVSTFTCQGLDHSISIEGLEKGVSFIESNIKNRSHDE